MRGLVFTLWNRDVPRSSMEDILHRRRLWHDAACRRPLLAQQQGYRRLHHGDSSDPTRYPLFFLLT